MGRYLTLLLLSVGAAVALAWLPQSLPGTARPLTDWQSRWTDDSTVAPIDDAWDAPGWTSLALPAHPARERQPMLWLRTRLPNTPLRDAGLSLDAVIAPFEAYVGSTRVRVHPDPEGLATRHPPGTPWQLIALPGDSGGKIFTLRVRSGGVASALRGTPLFGERADLLAWAIDRDGWRLACGLLIVLLGVLGGVTLARKNDWKIPLGFSLWAVMLGLYVVHYTHLKDVLLPAPRLWFGAWLAMVPLIPLGSALMCDGLFGSGPRGPLRISLRVFQAYTLLLVPCHAIGWWLYHSGPARERASVFLFTLALGGLRVLIVVGLLVFMAVIGRRALAGQRDARIFLWGLFAYFAFAVRDVAAALGAASLSWKSQVHLGALALTVASVLVLQRRYAEAHRRAAALAEETVMRAQEKERLLRDLHDGIGGLTSNMRVLAELGQRNEARSQKALATIADLSAQALTELRSFVRALDDGSMTWEALAAELRRHGAQLFEAAGVGFTMTSTLDAPGRPPGLLSLNLLRIFRESLTNALKQSGLSSVTVTLEARASELRLLLISDGTAAGQRDGGTGRGLANMRARALEMGGTLEVEVGDRTTVRLQVPLPMKSPIVAPAEPLLSNESE